MTVNRQMNEQVTIYKPAGDQGILIQFGNQINTETNRTIRVFAALIERENREGIGEVIIGFSTLLVHYNPSLLSFQDAVAWLKRLEQRVQNIEPGRVRCVKIPVLYGGQWGPDLANVAKMNGLTEEEVVRIHSRPNYLVFFLGFTPGFPFLGGMSDKIATPRLATPRLSIPRGSVGIANHQTGIYPLESPGGWQLIGRTPLLLYHADQEHPFLLAPGDYVRFVPIEEQTFRQIEQQVAERRYTPDIQEVEEGADQ